ncbi:MAG: hypothetical protein M1821_004491 [Bathelium mastoideum]|nr:MAG: hypothetical protein M1821_004491 [Bathelium mastoideum]
MTNGGSQQQLDHSGLEVVQAGLEVDHTQNAPQVIDGVAPEVFDNAEKEPLQIGRVASGRRSNGSSGRPIWRTKIFWITTAAVAVTAIALGIGLGIGLKKAQGSNSRTASSQPSKSPPSNSSGSTTAAASSPSVILHESSLGSTIRINGERHVFFQNQNGIVREAIYQNNTGWTAPTSYVIATDAKNNTPLAAYNVPEGQSEGNIVVEGLYLFYVNTNGSIVAQTFRQEEWSPGPAIQLSNSPVDVSPSTRSISVNYMQFNTSTDYTVIIIYEDSDGHYNAIQSVTDGFDSFNWTNGDLSAVDLRGANIQGPVSQCSTCPDSQDGGDQTSILAGVFDGAKYSVVGLTQEENNLDVLTAGGAIGLQVSNTYNESAPQILTASDLTCNYVCSPSQSVVGAFIFWINDTALQVLLNTTPVLVPAYPFPSLRLSAVTPINSSQLFLYNQFNGSLISEHIYDTFTGHWTSSNISIETH